MFKRTIFSALAIAAGVGAGILLKVLRDRQNETEDEEYDDDEEIHFIRINDDDDETEEPAAEEQPEISPEVKEICGLYPYLKPEFISHLLDKNDELNKAYPEDTLVTLVHNAEFAEKSEAEGFVEIMEPAGYQCAVEENGAVTAAKKLFTEEGAIISDILNVANQTAALKGTYKDYQVQ
ncbi:MAG: hypothetical protein IKG53_06180 [Solobacterium sp.]|nr:hypothetical protein [Solobacterium sp.]